MTSPADVVFGVERELAAAVFDRRGQISHGGNWLHRLLEDVARQVPVLPDHSGRGLFLANGGRLYIDCGHPEICTPEVTSPDDLVAYLRAAEHLVWRAAQRVQSQRSASRGDRAAAGGTERAVLALREAHGNSPPSATSGPEARFAPYVGRTSICYASGSTFGAHETYTARALPSPIERWLAPHLASRVIYTGAGGLECRRGSLRFVLSPRAMHLSDRAHGPLVCTERRAVSRRARCHIAVGEGVCSDLSVYLATGCTALVLAALAEGDAPGRELRLAHPPSALGIYAADPTLRATAENERGQPVTAWDVQWGYLRLVEQRLGTPQMPDWAIEATSLWRYVLEQLQDNREAVSTTLDWAIKERLFRAEAERQGMDWAALQSVSHPTRERSGLGSRSLAHILASFRQLSHFNLEPHVEGECQSGTEAPNSTPPSRLRAALCMLDAKFSEIGEGGLFSQLDASGCLNHRAVSLARVARAAVDPPSSPGRAQLRGRLVQRLARTPQSYHVSWTSVVDESTGRRLDMTDEFCSGEQLSDPENWTIDTHERLPRRRHAPNQNEILAEAETYYDRGCFGAARMALQGSRSMWLSDLFPAASTAEQLLCRRGRHLWARVETRCGTEYGLHILQMTSEPSSEPLWHLNELIYAHRFGRLWPNVPRMEMRVKQGNRLINELEAGRDDHEYPQDPDHNRNHDLIRQYDRLAEHSAALLLAQENWDAARSAAHRLAQRPRALPPSEHLLACVTWGHACMAMGRYEEAEQAFDSASIAARETEAAGERMEYWMPWRTALDDDSTARRQLLRMVETLDDARNYVGALRCLFLAGRRTRSTTQQRSLRQRIEGFLGDVPLWRDAIEVRQILSRWQCWCGTISRASYLPRREWFCD